MTVCDSSGKCVEANQAICEIIGATREQVLSQNYNQLESWRESGLWEVVTEAVANNRSASKKTTLTSTFGKELTANVHISPFSFDGEGYVLFVFDDLSVLQRAQDEREKLIADLQHAAAEIDRLRSILPICSYCKKIRNERGDWEHVDIYLRDHLSTDLSHGICPKCSTEHYPEFADVPVPDKNRP